MYVVELSGGRGAFDQHWYTEQDDRVLYDGTAATFNALQ